MSPFTADDLEFIALAGAAGVVVILIAAVLVAGFETIQQARRERRLIREALQHFAKAGE